MNYCKKCILPENYPGISFNEEGVCNFCLAYQPQETTLGKDQLIILLNSKPMSGEYDCIVPLSGGKDSTYILYYTVRELGLHPLAVSYNSGYQNRIAEENIQSACDKLGVPLEIIRSPGDIQGKLLKKSYLLAKRYDSYWNACLNCEAILRVVSKNTAKKHHVPFILWGSSTLEAFNANKISAIKGIESNPDPQEKQSTFFSRILKGLLKDPLKLVRHIPFYVYNILQRVRMGLPLKYALNPGSTPPLSRDNPQFIHFFDYIQWDSIQNVTLLEHELGWQHPEGKDTRFDCRLHCVGNYNRLDKCGITADGINLCNFIREGKMSREEAVEREAEIAASVDEEFNALVEEIL